MEKFNYIGSVAIEVEVEDMTSDINNLVDDILTEELSLASRRVWERLKKHDIQGDVWVDYQT